ncbi:MAG: KH domain-containing protein [Lentisphaeria bacterium]
MGISFFKKIFGVATESSTEETEKKTVETAKKIPEPKLNAADFADPESDESSSISLASLEAFVLYVVQALVDEPEQVQLETVEKNRIHVIQIRCIKKDIGKIIGKSGKTISAIRLLVSGAAGRIGMRVTVDVLD